MSSPRIISILERCGKVEWARIVAGPTREGRPSPPLIVWRWQIQAGEKRDAEFRNAVESFRGRIDWILDHSGRNWVLIPRRLSQMLSTGDWRTDSELVLYISENESTFAQESMDDLVDMMVYLEQVL